jgi:enoyl-CoA hydratase/carnithine racemase
MIEVETVDNVAIVRMQHGKANALDIEFCEALAARFH